MKQLRYKTMSVAQLRDALGRMDPILLTTVAAIENVEDTLVVTTIDPRHTLLPMSDGEARRRSPKGAGRPMHLTTRQQETLDIIKSSPGGFATVDDIEYFLGVSRSTAGRLLHKLLGLDLVTCNKINSPHEWWPTEQP